MAGENISTREEILMIAAMSGGEIRKDICRDICGTQGYYNTMMARMSDELTTVFGSSPRTGHITKKGCERISGLIPWVMDAYDSHKLANQRQKSVRHAEISRMVYNMILSGVPWSYVGRGNLVLDGNRNFGEDAFGYYCPFEAKAFGGDALHKSKICGVLFADGKIILLYNMEDRNIRYIKKSEEITEVIFANGAPGRTIEKAVYGNGYEMLDTVWKNGERVERLKSFNPREENCVTPGTRAWYIPNGREGTVSLKALLRPDIVRKTADNIGKREQREVLCTIPFYIPSVTRIRDNVSDAIILCLESQYGYIRGIAEKDATIRMINDADMGKVLDRAGYGWNTERAGVMRERKGT